jgi:hypothetical protein
MPKFPQWIQQLAGSEESIEPLLVPGNWFVTRAFAVPEELNAKEIDEFAELSVEEISPFNLVQLNWGYYFDEESNRAFVYTAFDQKLRKDLAESELFDYAFPDFSQTFGLKFDSATLIFLIHESTLSGILLPANDSVPQAVVGITLDVEFSREDLETAKEHIIQRIRAQVGRVEESSLAEPVSNFDLVEVGKTIYHRNWDQADTKGKPAIELLPYGDERGNPWRVEVPANSSFWAMDIRKAEEKELLEKRHGWTNWFWRASVIVLFLFLLLGISEFGIIALNKWYEKELAIAAEARPKAEDVEQKMDILAKINQITTNQLLPFEMLNAINVVRPSNIYFTRISAEGGNSLQIEAVTLNASEIDGFEKTLKDTGMLSLVEISNFRDNKGRGTFRLRVEFNPGSLQPQNFLADS